MSAICIIPARGGSRRIPRKNIRLFHGKPIIAYSIEAAKECGLFDRGIYVSTEDEEIAKVAKNYGAQIVNRRPELAEIGAPDCGTQEVTRDALETLGITDGFACCLYATAPLMDWRDLRAAFTMFPIQRQQAPFIYAVCGWRDAAQFYWGHAQAFLQRVKLDHWSTMRFAIQEDRYCDINTEDDWTRAERMYENLHRAVP